MLNLLIDAKNLVKWARRLDEVPTLTKKSIAASLNTAGDNIIRELSMTLSASTGLAPEMVRRMIKVRRATDRRMEWSVDVAEVGTPTGMKRAMPKRGLPGTRAEDAVKEELVTVMTMRDDKVCPICDDIKKGGPYTPQEVEDMSKRLNRYGGGLFHPHCRCGTVPFNPSRRLLVSARGDEFGGEAAKHMSIKQIAAQVRKNTKITLKVPGK